MVSLKLNSKFRLSNKQRAGQKVVLGLQTMMEVMDPTNFPRQEQTKVKLQLELNKQQDPVGQYLVGYLAQIMGSVCEDKCEECLKILGQQNVQRSLYNRRRSPPPPPRNPPTKLYDEINELIGLCCTQCCKGCSTCCTCIAQCPGITFNQVWDGQSQIWTNVVYGDGGGEWDAPVKQTIKSCLQVCPSGHTVLQTVLKLCLVQTMTNVVEKSLEYSGEEILVEIPQQFLTPDELRTLNPLNETDYDNYTREDQKPYKERVYKGKLVVNNNTDTVSIEILPEFRGMSEYEKQFQSIGGYIGHQLQTDNLINRFNREVWDQTDFYRFEKNNNGESVKRNVNWIDQYIFRRIDELDDQSMPPCDEMCGAMCDQLDVLYTILYNKFEENLPAMKELVVDIEIVQRDIVKSTYRNGMELYGALTGAQTGAQTVTPQVLVTPQVSEDTPQVLVTPQVFDEKIDQTFSHLEIKTTLTKESDPERTMKTKEKEQ